MTPSGNRIVGSGCPECGSAGAGIIALILEINCNNCKKSSSARIDYLTLNGNELNPKENVIKVAYHDKRIVKDLRCPNCDADDIILTLIAKIYCGVCSSETDLPIHCANL